MVGVRRALEKCRAEELQGHKGSTVPTAACFSNLVLITSFCSFNCSLCVRVFFFFFFYNHQTIFKSSSLVSFLQIHVHSTPMFLVILREDIFFFSFFLVVFLWMCGRERHKTKNF